MTIKGRTAPEALLHDLYNCPSSRILSRPSLVRAFVCKIASRVTIVKPKVSRSPFTFTVWGAPVRSYLLSHSKPENHLENSITMHSLFFLAALSSPALAGKSSHWLLAISSPARGSILCSNDLPDIQLQVEPASMSRHLPRPVNLCRT